MSPPPLTPSTPLAPLAITKSAITTRTTTVLPISPSAIGNIIFPTPGNSLLTSWTLHLSSSFSATSLLTAASQLKHGSLPVAFPTETVYGLGADATRQEAVQAIYEVKGRPADNPLIVHVWCLAQLRSLLIPPSQAQGGDIGSEGGAQAQAQAEATADDPDPDHDPIPNIYRPLIQRFWPGPLTIILPLPSPSPFAPQVTSSLPTFGARMPSSLLALALIHLAGTPLAAPSANTSSKPSPTTAAHVLHDLCGRIELILDGGPCEVGIESTVVDGLVSPPQILRPGGVGIEDLRRCPGWEDVVVGYGDRNEAGNSGSDEREGGEEAPRAPGMKYKHYSPSAKVVLVDGVLDLDIIRQHIFPESGQSIGVLATKKWSQCDFLRQVSPPAKEEEDKNCPPGSSTSPFNLPHPSQQAHHSHLNLFSSTNNTTNNPTPTWTIFLGSDTRAIAHGLFAALRDLDLRGVGTIFVESVEQGTENDDDDDDDGSGRRRMERRVKEGAGSGAKGKKEGGRWGAGAGEKEEGRWAGVEAAAIMNRLRKAADVLVRAGG